MPSPGGGAAPRVFEDDINDLFHVLIFDNDLELHLRQEVVGWDPTLNSPPERGGYAVRGGTMPTCLRALLTRSKSFPRIMASTFFMVTT